MERNYDAWNEVKKETDEKIPLINIKAGEIRWCRFGINIGKEIIGKGSTFKRPVLILKKFSEEMFLGVPISLQIRTGTWYYSFVHEDITRCLIFNQARSFDRKRLEHKLFEIPESDLLPMKKAYCDLLMKT